jgi:hypothetical protein
MIFYSNCHKLITFERRLRIDDEPSVDFRFWNADFGFMVFCLFY